MSTSHASAEQPSVMSADNALVPAIDAALNKGGIVIEHETTSKKRLLEQLSEMFAARLTDLSADTIFTILIERENIGSTGIGEGVALPHARIPGLQETVALFVRLSQPMDYDAIDRQPVQLIFALLVPEAATDEHLRLLASLAARFRNSEVRNALRDSDDIDDIRHILTTRDSST
jgi:PTS system nitrogen regulatory IIA component